MALSHAFAKLGERAGGAGAGGAGGGARVREIRAAARGVLRVWWRRRRLAPCHATLDRSAPCAPSCRGRAVRGAQGHGAGRNGRAVLIHMDAVVAAASAGQLALGDHLLGGGGARCPCRHTRAETRGSPGRGARGHGEQRPPTRMPRRCGCSTRAQGGPAPCGVCVCVCVCACMRACMRGPALDIAAGAVD